MNKIDYDVYRLSAGQWGIYLIEAVCACIGINYLFYKSLAVFFFMLPLPFWYVHQRKKQQIRLRKKRLNYQFKDALNAMQVGISAGYSLDNTIREARRDLERLYGQKADMVREFAYIEKQLGHSVPLEELLYDLGIRSRVEEILNFTDVLIQAKKMGGNMRVILNRCISSIEERIQVKKEIDTILASRKMEQKIMSFIPLGIILYMQLTSPEFLGVLYGNPLGICVMTVCLLLYIAAFQWGVRLTQIDI